jgi:hypothetical protein
VDFNRARDSNLHGLCGAIHSSCGGFKQRDGSRKSSISVRPP